MRVRAWGWELRVGRGGMERERDGREDRNEDRWVWYEDRVERVEDWFKLNIFFSFDAYCLLILVLLVLLVLLLVLVLCFLSFLSFQVLTKSCICN